MTPWHDKYIRQFQANPGYNDAQKYGAQILHSAAPVWGERYFAVIGVHHLTGEENHGQHHAFCEVLDEAGNRIKGARINILTDGRPRGSMVIDKGDNEPGTNTQMHFEDTLTLYLAGDIPGEKVTGLHTRHEDEEQGTTRGHHSFLVIWQLKRVGNGPPPVDPPEEEEPDPTPEPQPVDWLTYFDDRQRKQIAFSRLYARDFSHGATGHNDMLIIAKMAELLDGTE